MNFKQYLKEQLTESTLMESIDDFLKNISYSNLSDFVMELEDVPRIKFDKISFGALKSNMDNFIDGEKIDIKKLKEIFLVLWNALKDEKLKDGFKRQYAIKK